MVCRECRDAMPDINWNHPCPHHAARCGCPTDGEFVYHRRACAIGKRRRGWSIAMEFKPQDLWVGAFWKRIGNCVDLWVCLLPMVPIHISWWWSSEP